MELKFRILSAAILAAILAVLGFETDLIAAYPQYALILGIVFVAVREAVKEYGIRAEK